MNRYPAIVSTVDRARREIRVEIPGITDGAELLPLAEIEYPIGDRTEATEIRIVEGDRVWVAFQGGDPRYPIITGFRAKHTDNEVGTRRWFHDNFETIANAQYRVQAGERLILDVGGTLVTITPGLVQIDSAEVVVNGDTTFNGKVDIVGAATVSETLAVQGGISSAVSMTAPAATIGGIGFGTHRHKENGSGGGVTDGPQ